MGTDEDKRKLTIILISIISIITIILIIYLVTTVFDVSQNQPNIPQMTTTKPFGADFTELSADEKQNFNAYFNEIALMLAFNNLTANNFNMKGINLLESEVNKFKFIYTYWHSTSPDQAMSMATINQSSLNFFETELLADNLTNYLTPNGYQYDIINPDLKFCLKVNKQKGKTLLIDVINKEGENLNFCDINVINYDSSLVTHQISLTYDLINNNYIYKSFIIVK